MWLYAIAFLGAIRNRCSCVMAKGRLSSDYHVTDQLSFSHNATENIQMLFFTKSSSF